MIRQPVSRISFDRRRGFLGVHLQEGALFVDSAWNEDADIAWSQLRDALLAGGVAGTAGPELRIDPSTENGRLRNLWVRGTSSHDSVAPRPFYCDGLPVLWPADLMIDSQWFGDAFRSEATGDSHVPAGRTWIDLLQQDVLYEIYLRARVATLDRLDDPFLDDPGLDAARGTFRKRVVAEVRIRKAFARHPPVGTNLKLSVDGSYLSDLNVLYRVELDALTGSRAAPAASVLWDPDAGATVARVVDTAIEGARLVMVDTTEGFDTGFVRFEGKGVGPELYRVTKAPGLEGAAIQVTRHRCDRAEVSLATWQLSGQGQNPTAGQFTATFVVPAAVLSGEAPPIEVGDLVTALPAALGPSDTGPWTVQKVEQKVEQKTDPKAEQKAAPKADQKTDPKADQKVNQQTALVTLTFGPAGLVQQLLTLDTRRKARLRVAARQFDTTLTVDARSDWRVGDRISILRNAGENTTVTLRAIEAREDRVIVRVEHLPGGLEVGEWRRAGTPATPTMVVRLDQPLSYDHAVGDEEVIPERPIRVRRFAGHACRLGIDRIDPAHDGAASIANFSFAQQLPDGLSLHLTLEESDGQARLERGDGWHFAARSDGWVETRLFAPVEDEPASEVPLARLTVNAHGYELIDLRPLPAALAVDGELARIGAAATAIARLLGDDPASHVASDAARLSGHARVQPRLLPRLHELAKVHSKLHATPACRPWLEQLDRAVAEVGAGNAPTRRQFATIAFSIGGLAFAFSTTHSRDPGVPQPPRPAAPKPPEPSVKLAPRPGALDEADAVLGGIAGEDELEVIASLTVTSFEVVTEIATPAPTAPTGSEKADEPKPPAAPAPKKP